MKPWSAAQLHAAVNPDFIIVSCASRPPRLQTPWPATRHDALSRWPLPHTPSGRPCPARRLDPAGEPGESDPGLVVRIIRAGAVPAPAPRASLKHTHAACSRGAVRLIALSMATLLPWKLFQKVSGQWARTQTAPKQLRVIGIRNMFSVRALFKTSYWFLGLVDGSRSLAA